MNDLVFLVDVDNTLLDNDEVKLRLESNMADMIGSGRTKQFFDIYQLVREEFDFVNFPVALERFSQVCDDTNCLAYISHSLYGFPFSKCVFPGTAGAIEYMKSIGLPVILSDGDQLFQRYKIRSAGLEEAVNGNVLVFVHKELETASIRERFPAKHYVMIDDKPRIHAALKTDLGDLITTVQVRQGKYAMEPPGMYSPGPDIVIESIKDMRGLTTAQLNGR